MGTAVSAAASVVRAATLATSEASAVMAASLSILSKVVGNKVEGLFKSDEPEKSPPSEKELKDEEKRKLAQKEAEEERKKRHVKEEYQREKVRQEMRDKYGIQKKSTGGRPKTEVLEEIKKDYGMNDKDARALQQKISEDAAQREAAKAKVDKKMETRKMKKEIKKDLGVDKCKQQ